MSRRPRWIALGVVAAPVVLELGLRLLLIISGDAYDASETRAELLAVRSAVLAPIPGSEADPQDLNPSVRNNVLHPYLGWDAPNRTGQFEDELRYFRSKEARETFDVMIVGGSVAGLVGDTGREALTEALKATGKVGQREVRILNHGRGSFKQPQQILLVCYALGIGYEPEAVVNIDGFNEVALGAENASLGVSPFHPHWVRLGPLASSGARTPEGLALLAQLRSFQDELVAEIDDAVEGWRLRSAWLGRWARTRVARLAADRTELQDAVVAELAARAAVGSDDSTEPDPLLGPHFEGGPAASIKALAAGWSAASIQLDAVCKAQGIVYLHALQPTLHDTGMKPLTPGEVEIGKMNPIWRQAVMNGYPQLREAGAVLVGRGIAFVDTSDTFVSLKEEIYYDGCHFRGPGMVMFAERVGRELGALLP